MKIRIVNKIVEYLDLVVNQLRMKHDIDSDKSCCFNKSLSESISKVGARLENYYNGTLSGRPCSNLMFIMEKFCTHVFLSNIAPYGILSC